MVNSQARLTHKRFQQLASLAGMAGSLPGMSYAPFSSFAL
jgi:hypothetical protein